MLLLIAHFGAAGTKNNVGKCSNALMALGALKTSPPSPPCASALHSQSEKKGRRAPTAERLAASTQRRGSPEQVHAERQSVCKQTAPESMSISGQGVSSGNHDQCARNTMRAWP